jgi:O-antigen/teichoic acid export membrane protein
MIFSKHQKSKSERYINVQNNLLGLFFLKGINIFVTFLSLPLILGYLDATKYGIWLTISSVIGWAGIFDLGLSNGLRNLLGRSLTEKNYLESRKIVSTTFVLLLLIIVPLFSILIFIIPKFNWGYILNAPTNLNEDIRTLILCVFCFFCVRFVSGLIFTVLSTDHKSAMAEFLTTCISVLNLILIYVLIKYTKNSLFYLGFFSSLLMTLIPLIASLWFFNKGYKFVSPSFKFYDKTKIKELLNQGVGFFFIQISALVLFSTDNMIISQVFSPAEVVPFNISYRLFSLTTMVFGIILTPFWSAYTEAYHKSDFNWITRTTKKLLYIFALYTIGVFVLLIFSQFFYEFWLGSKVSIPFKISMFMSVFVVVQGFNMIFVTFIFSTGKVKVQMYLAVITAILNIPLSIYLSKNLGLGPSGVILATSICGAFNIFFAPMQYYRLIKGKANGIWNR